MPDDVTTRRPLNGPLRAADVPVRTLGGSNRCSVECSGAAFAYAEEHRYSHLNPAPLQAAEDAAAYLDFPSGLE